MTDKEHLDKLLKLVRLFQKLMKMRGIVPVYPEDKIGVRGLCFAGVSHWSFNEMKAGWYVRDDLQKVSQFMCPSWSMRRTDRPLEDGYDALTYEERKLVEEVPRIQYGKKKRQIWYSEWSNSCPRFSLKTIEDLL